MSDKSAIAGGHKTRVGFASLGCPKNLVDSEIMIGRLAVDGFELTNDPAEAEVLVVNTCAFIDSAKEESVNTILEMARYKEIGQCQRLVVAGCLAQRYREQLLADIPEIDALIGLDELDKIEAACHGDFKQVRRNTGMSRRLYGAGDGRLSTGVRFSRYLKISEGCDHKCSFCVIPSFRGLHRSRSIGDIVAEANDLAGKGALEVNLVAQDLGAYGKDIGTPNGLPGVLHALSELDALRWIRLHYIYPMGLTAELQGTLATEPKCVPYLDIPFQHGSDKVLKDMRRPGSSIKSLAKIEELRSNIPGLALRTSIIVGFPTETEEDFDELVDFIQAARFEHLGVFTYSHEENSEAAKRYQDVVPPEVKEERRERIMAIQQEISLQHNEKMVGSRQDVLVEGLHPESDMLLSGRLSTQAPDVDGLVIINDGEAQPGEIVSVEITEAHPYDLVGRIIDEQ